jgi:CrcB protein
MKFLAIGAGGFVGALLRYALSALAHRLYDGPFPIGTLVVNVLGCLAIGVVMFLIEERGALNDETRLFLRIGILGSMTTFSAFGFETFDLARNGAWGAALASVLGNVVLGLAAVVVGWTVTKSLLH